MNEMNERMKGHERTNSCLSSSIFSFFVFKYNSKVQVDIFTSMYQHTHLLTVIQLLSSYWSPSFLCIRSLDPETVDVSFATTTSKGRLLARSINKKIILVDVRLIFGLITPSQGHTMRVYKCNYQ